MHPDPAVHAPWRQLPSLDDAALPGVLHADSVVPRRVERFDRLEALGRRIGHLCGADEAARGGDLAPGDEPPLDAAARAALLGAATSGLGEASATQPRIVSSVGAKSRASDSGGCPARTNTMI